MRVEKEGGKAPIRLAGFGRPLGEVLSSLLGRGEDCRPGAVAAEARRHVRLSLASDLSERFLADRELGRLVESMLSWCAAGSVERPLGLRIHERGRLAGLDGLLRPRLSWVQIQLSGDGAEVSEMALEERLTSLGYRKIERVTRVRPSAALSLFWRAEEKSLPLVVESRSAAGEARLSLLIPEISF